MTDTVTISPCPFCGGEAEIIKGCGSTTSFDGERRSIPVYRAYCRSCAGCSGSRTSEELAVEAWNRRAFPPSPSEACPGEGRGLREALDESTHALKWAATVIRPGSDLRDAMDAALAKAERILSVSPDDGWVKVDESHPLPHDLQAGDMVKTVKTATVLKRTNDLIWVEAAFSTLGYETMKPEVITHYRRRRPSAEQGG